MKKRDLVAAGAVAILATLSLAQAGATSTAPVKPEPAIVVQVSPATPAVAAPAETGAAESRRVVRVIVPSPYHR